MEKCKMEHLSKTTKWIKTFLKIAILISNHSYCQRKKVGCVLVKENKILSFGYNGTPYGFDNKCEINNKTKKEVLHAESNAILKCAISNENCESGIIFTTLSPCFDCCKIIIQAKIKSVYYLEEYHDTSGLELLSKSKIYYERIQL